jgi:hypothetical protein
MLLVRLHKRLNLWAVKGEDGEPEWIGVDAGDHKLVARKRQGIMWLFLVRRPKGTGKGTQIGLPSTMWEFLRQQEGLVSFPEDPIPA